MASYPWMAEIGRQDIGWAEAVGFEFMARSIVQSPDVEGHFQTYGDNEGVIGGWCNGRSRNCAVNKVFWCIYDPLNSTGGCTDIQVVYVLSKLNPADVPSRGIFPSCGLLLLPIQSQAVSCQHNTPLHHH